MDDDKIDVPGHERASRWIREDSEQLDIVPQHVRVIRHERVKYACPCCDGAMHLAAARTQFIDRTPSCSLFTVCTISSTRTPQSSSARRVRASLGPRFRARAAIIGVSR